MLLLRVICPFLNYSPEIDNFSLTREENNIQTVSMK